MTRSDGMSVTVNGFAIGATPDDVEEAVTAAEERNAEIRREEPTRWAMSQIRSYKYLDQLKAPIAPLSTLAERDELAEWLQNEQLMNGQFDYFLEEVADRGLMVAEAIAVARKDWIARAQATLATGTEAFDGQ